MISEKTSIFLLENGFKIVEFEEFDSFGDYCKIFTNELIQLRFSSSKSIESIDIRRDITNEKWFDLAFVKVLINNEDRLNIVTTIGEYEFFLLNNLTYIIKRFDKDYSTTKKELNKLEEKRAKQMFSKLL